MVFNYFNKQRTALLFSNAYEGHFFVVLKSMCLEEGGIMNNPPLKIIGPPLLKRSLPTDLL